VLLQPLDDSEAFHIDRICLRSLAEFRFFPRGRHDAIARERANARLCVRNLCGECSAEVARERESHGFATARDLTVDERVADGERW
jgi:hypothetical protein